MNSPLQGAARRGPGWNGPTFATRRRRPRRVGLRRFAGILAGLGAGLAVGLTLGAGDAGDSTRLGAVGVGAQLDAGRGPAEGAGDREASDQEASAIALSGEDTVGVTLDDAPAAAVLFDVDSGEALWSQDSHEELPIASLTKIMTALIVVDELESPGRLVAIGASAAGPTGSGGVTGSAIGLEEGMRVKVAALFQAMLISSHNDAATALAVQAAGSPERFVTQMNRRADELGLDCTHFVSVHGLEPANRSCAADVAAMTRLAMHERRIREVARRERAVVDFPIEGGRRYLYTTNPLIEEGYPGTVGLKTGYTEQAGHSLAAVVRRRGTTLAAVVLDSPDPARHAQLLLDAAFEREGAGQTSAGGSLPQGSPDTGEGATTGSAASGSSLK